MKNDLQKLPEPVLLLIKTGNLLERFLTLIGGFAIIVFVSAVLLDVAARVLSRPLSWCQEIALFAFVWAIFMGSAIGIRHGTHFTIDLVINKTQGALRRWLDLFDHTIIILFVGVLSYYGWNYALNTIHRLSQPSGIPMIFGTICIFLGAVCMVYFSIEWYVLFFLGTDIDACISHIKGDNA